MRSYLASVNVTIAYEKNTGLYSISDPLRLYSPIECIPTSSKRGKQQNGALTSDFIKGSNHQSCSSFLLKFLPDIRNFLSPRLTCHTIWIRHIVYCVTAHRCILMGVRICCCQGNQDAQPPTLHLPGYEPLAAKTLYYRPTPVYMVHRYSNRKEEEFTSVHCLYSAKGE